MASVKEISNRIKSIQDTMKITRAMYMISSIKLRKAKKKLDDTEPYFYGLQNQISSILYHFPDVEHMYFDNREEDKTEKKKTKAFIVVTGDKAMCGAYNHNVIKEAQSRIEATDGDYKLFVVGAIGRQYFGGRGYNLLDDFAFTATNPSVHRARIITELVVDMYKQQEIDEVYVVYTRMINSMRSDVEVERLLPLKNKEFIKQEMQEKKKEASTESGHIKKYDTPDEEFSDNNNSDFTIFPSPDEVLEKLVYNYVTGFVYGALVEASASEENARMMAMNAATDNAQDMLKQLSIIYNKVRQASITQEITEVIGGAKALKKKKE